MTDTLDPALEAALAPCPFCGGSAFIDREGNARHSTIYMCNECGCSLETGETRNYGNAWNRRAAPQAEIDQLREALKAAIQRVREQLGQAGGTGIAGEANAQVERNIVGPWLDLVEDELATLHPETPNGGQHG